ncbi:BREX system Lon protease-like protein BrxL (plasmid) [Methanosphaera sp. ISO3-F5]|uniref:BREX system Lon protease-like protein BrxL n=1 Tax=Methanosphaera sp. ISO3-F5 TaxID=1452353 RepID=UPI002B257C81|nr:BREX system Lon protease-like protein BrxL [Methanosphaera sp. ISO3-F5]WQH65334.1 BREX system Lon protease-like protein BrxL [Methanosphaera sp. ISO3-F5]
MTLDGKIKNIFSEESVYKNPEKYSIFSGYSIPSFVKDWLIKRYSDDNDDLDEYGLKNFIENNMAYKDRQIKGTLMTEHRNLTLLARIIVEPDVKAGILRFSIPDAGLKMNECRIPEYVAKNHHELRGGEIWGIVTLSYLVPESNEKGVIELTKFKSFKPYTVDFEYFASRRKQFTLIEWIDFLIRSMEYNPEGFESFTQKLRFISRLLVFVEPNLNMMELAPKGTGKSYVFSNLSKYGWVVSGGTVTRAKLLYDIARESPGLLQQYQFLALDEIETIKFQDENELRGALKNYLESGSFTVAKYKGDSNCGLMVLGNIPLDENRRPKSKQYFAKLHKFFMDPALLDRFHGFIEGWYLPRMKEELKINGYGLNVEYFSEILNEMRSIPHFEQITRQMIEVPPKSDTRDTKAIIKITTAYLKLLFPHARTIDDVSSEDFEEYCLKPAIEMRGIIKYQISLIDDEFTDKLPNIKLR